MKLFTLRIRYGQIEAVSTVLYEIFGYERAEKSYIFKKEGEDDLLLIPSDASTPQLVGFSQEFYWTDLMILLQKAVGAESIRDVANFHNGSAWLTLPGIVDIIVVRYSESIEKDGGNNATG